MTLALWKKGKSGGLSKLGKGKWMAQVDQMYLRWVAYGLLLLAVSLLQAAPGMFPRFGGAHPLPLISAVVCIAMFEGPLFGAATGVCSGLLWALYMDRLFGFDALLLMIVGCICGLLVQVLLRNNWLTSILLNGAVLTVYALADWIARYVLFFKTDVFYALWAIILPDAIYTFVISPLVYVVCYYIARNLRETV